MFDRICPKHWRHSSECMAISSGMFGIPGNVWQYTQEYLRTFPGIFDDIPRNVLGHSPECFTTFPRMFGNTPQNFWRESTEYNIPPIPRVPHILFPVPIFLVFYIVKTNIYEIKPRRPCSHILPCFIFLVLMS